jgi:hypothetical protein
MTSLLIGTMPLRQWTKVNCMQLAYGNTNCYYFLTLPLGHCCLENLQYLEIFHNVLSAEKS